PVATSFFEQHCTRNERRRGWFLHGGSRWLTIVVLCRTVCEGPDALPRVPLSLAMDDSGGPRAPVVVGGRHQPLQPRHGRPGRGASHLQCRGVVQCAPAAAPPPIRRPGRVGGGTLRVGPA